MQVKEDYGVFKGAQKGGTNPTGDVNLANTFD